MADTDYAPAISPDEEEEEQRKLAVDYPPAESSGLTYSQTGNPLDVNPPAPSDYVSAPAPSLKSPAPAPGIAPQHDLTPAMSSGAPPVTGPQRPQWKDYAPAEPHGWAKFGHAMATLTRPTNYIFNQMPEKRAEEAYKNATAEYEAPIADDQKEAQTKEAEARTKLTEAQTETALHPPDKTGLTPEEKFMDDALHGDKGRPRLDPQGKPYTYLSAHQAWKQSEQDVKPEKDRKTEKTTRVIGGVPHEVLVDAETGADIKDLGQTKIPGESPADRRAANESAQVEREARQNIRKAEGQYRDTQKSVGQLTESIDAAKDGNGLLTSFVPTMEVLGINAANGVHRISPAEAQAANLPGGWAERFNAWFNKAATGKISPELVTEGKALAHILLKSAYQRYKSTYDDESSIVSGYGGTGFNQRVPAVKEEQGGGGGEAPDGTVIMVNGQQQVKQNGKWVPR